MKKVRQFRYYSNGDERNFPRTLLLNDLINHNIFQQYGVVLQLGIQAPPRTRFYLNNGESSIMVGVTGIYELDMENLGIISSIRFDEQSINNDEEIRKNIQNDGLIIDIIYEGA